MRDVPVGRVTSQSLPHHPRKKTSQHFRAAVALWPLGSPRRGEVHESPPSVWGPSVGDSGPEDRRGSQQKR